MSWDPNLPFEALPPLPPPGDVETPSVLKATVEARAALARFDALAMALPNPAILIESLPLLEAQASSEIEAIVTTADELFRASAFAEAATPEAREALRYRTALWAAFNTLQDGQPITNSLVAHICGVIRGHEVSIRRSGGIYIGNPITGARSYTPPDDPRPHMASLMEFLNARTSLDPLVSMALAHYQFEAIHPFTDGNGRTGRILNILILSKAGLLQQPLLYLSRHIIRTKDEYYQRLRDVTANAAWESWICYLLRGVVAVSGEMDGLLSALRKVEDQVTGVVTVRTGRADARLIDLLMERPYVRVRDVVARCDVTRQTASRWLNAVAADGGVLKQLSVGRNVLYLNRPLIEAFTS